ncbi:glutaminase [Streptantibioticus cattleyicolor]|uniref:Glutaminase n=1 Tax=Streptantibioticus cattleyicolor (strain ATCC 35852 / DSM 46488 / JCM 4925 / NBRC 14057 / NRRL 8057) TaxID=1003195 RepID=F8JMT6_STREN|nr:glutaminase [Streptantibioticus cattleyicolor]AEW99277.1 glutaminase [Streptantibioticus cattleyicolor NRRL 8057 = DSM 46488]CCB71682.1 Glutaminase [Streptantibioticus cattleyicolor NRRL 8057 = DSM 46488]
MDYRSILADVASEVQPYIGRGQAAQYIPALANAELGRFGMALADVDGDVVGVGDWEVPFSVQSISKAFSLALVLARDGEGIWRRVGREPSGNPFNSLVQLEHENGIPRNPFINAGALVVTDRLQSLTGDAAGAMLEFLRAESENPHLAIDQAVVASESAHGDRNAALAHFMASYGNLENPVADVLHHYFSQCSIEMSCRDLALAGRVMARYGVRADGSRLMSRREIKRINAVMLTCGTYDAAGDFAYRVGLPGKSGVGGGIIAVVPGRCSLCVWSPGLDTRGNSVAGVAALDLFTTITGWSVF